MNEFEMVVAIVLIVMISVTMMVRAKYQHRRSGGDHVGSTPHGQALEQEVERLRDRVKVLERIAVEKEDTLAREIEQLRER